MPRVDQDEFVSIRRAALRLGVPICWLQVEVRAGRLPALRVGRRLLCNVAAVRTQLLNRAEANVQELEASSA